MTNVQQWLEDNSDLPRRDCEILFEHVASTSRAEMLAFPERNIDETVHAQLAADANLLRDGQPLAYVLGEWEFWGLKLTVTPATLIPRPETELLVEWAAARAAQNARVLDLGTGSGAIALAIKSERPDLIVTAIDNSARALEVAKLNAQYHNLEVDFKLSDWFSNISGQWDIIVGNPPYIEASDSHLADLKFEPNTALVSGSDGLTALRQISLDAAQHLSTTGLIALEHGYNQGQSVHNLLQQAGFADIGRCKDLAGITRMTYAAKPTALRNN